MNPGFAPGFLFLWFYRFGAFLRKRQNKDIQQHKADAGALPHTDSQIKGKDGKQIGA